MNWADSSDDESQDELHPARLATSNSIEVDHDLSYDDSQGEAGPDADDGDDADLELEKEVIPYPPPIDMEHLPENFPTEKPFTAHVKNVAFNIKSEEDLGTKIQGLVRFRYQGDKRVTVTAARFGIDRQTGKRRGYSYVEFDTAEELMLFVNINDGHSKINGRPISIDVARPPQSNNRQGNGRNNNNNSNRRDHHSNNNRGGGDTNSNIDGSKFRGGIRRDNRDNSGTADQQRERTSLKLQPRSKPAEDKPSDGDNWRSSREGPGGRGRGRGGRDRDRDRGGGRGKRNTNTRNGRGNGQGNANNNSTSTSTSKSGENKSELADGWDSAPKTAKAQNAAPAPVKVVEKKKKATKVTNAFAALNMDSDSD